MPMTLEQLTEEALALPTDERTLLVDRLTESLETTEEAKRTERLWIEECERRIADLRSGRVKEIPGEEVLAEMRRKVGR